MRTDVSWIHKVLTSLTAAFIVLIVCLDPAVSSGLLFSQVLVPKVLAIYSGLVGGGAPYVGVTWILVVPLVDI